MAKFITLTNSVTGNRELVQVSHIVRRWPEGTGTVIAFPDSLLVFYRETPGQIDALLGVTESALSLLAELVDGMPDVEDSATRVLERSRKLIAAARGE